LRSALINRLRRIARSRPAVVLVVAASAFAVLMVLRATGALEAPELAWYDLQLERASTAWVSAPPIALVLIEEDDIRRFGHPLPVDLMSSLL
jgi:CHASE2 domain-containing sensor protein